MSGTVTYPASETFTREEWEARLKSTEVTRLWMVDRETGEIWPGVKLPKSGTMIVDGPQGPLTLGKTELDRRYMLVIGPKVIDAPFDRETEEAIRICLPDGVEPKPYNE